VRLAGAVIVLAITGSGYADPLPRVPSVPLFSFPSPPSPWAGPAFVDTRRTATPTANLDAVIQDPTWILVNFVGTTLLRIADTPSRRELDLWETRKRAYLARTDTDRMPRALYHLPAWLEWTWKNKAWPPERRRRLLFELWDSCADDASGDFARATIIAFIRRDLPEGSPHAYPTRSSSN
jgi:hypothetical protein